jgi:hypothetical protein
MKIKKIEETAKAKKSEKNSRKTRFQAHTIKIFDILKISTN